MKKIIFLFVSMLCLCATNVQAQYIPFAKDCEWSAGQFKFKTCGDTLINGVEYIKIYHQFSDRPFDFDMDKAEYWGACRNDTAQKKVYFLATEGTIIISPKPNGNKIYDTLTQIQEVLFYDFSLKIGDSITIYQFENNNKTLIKVIGQRVNSGSLEVGWQDAHSVTKSFAEEDSVVNCGENQLKQMIIHELEFDMPMPKFLLWIESIGSSNGFMSTGEHLMADLPLTRLLCYTDNNGNTYQTGFDFDNDSTDCYNNGFGGGIEDMINEKALTVYPNPTSNKVQINISEAYSMQTIQLYNIYGQLLQVFDADRSQQYNLSLENYSAGVYVLRIITTDNQVIEHKIIKQ